MTTDRSIVKTRGFSSIDRGLLISVYLYTCPHWTVFTTAKEQYCKQCGEEGMQEEGMRPLSGYMRSRLVGVVSLTLDPETQALKSEVI